MRRTSSVYFIMAYCVAYSSLEKTELMDKLMPVIGALCDR